MAPSRTSTSTAAGTAYNSRERALSDPLAMAIRPPEDETPDQRAQRVAQEEEAKRVSDLIDEQIKAERSRNAGRKKEVKILLLGQSESGKSTTLKQFQILYAPNAFQEECAAWRPIVYLNLVRSIRRILEALAFNDDLDDNASNGRPGTATSRTNIPTDDLAAFAELRQRLKPLLQLEDTLIEHLSSPEEEEATRLGPWNGPRSTPDKPSGNKEVWIRSGAPWKKALGKFGKRKESAKNTPEEPDADDPVHVLIACKKDMLELWHDPRVRDVLKRRKLRLEESSGFYLNDIERVTALNYVPTSDDVLKARLKTVGVVEHLFPINGASDKSPEWRIIDVGGARNQRQAWAQFFEDANSLIFLAPISAFDQVLAEDPDVNRVEDSLLLWRSICANKLLVNVAFVLFLNKCDLLRAKLEAGVKLNKFMPSYGDRPNDYDSISKYFKSKFQALHRSYSPSQERQFYIHLTCVTDTRTTSSIIVSVRDVILRDRLKGASLLM